MSAPFCNVTVAEPPGKPASPKGLQTIPPNATMQQIISIVNNNFNLLKGNFTEVRAARQSVITRIYDPEDNDSFVDVRNITQVVFVNPLTGQTVTWKR